MATLQQSIEINQPHHVVCDRLVQFENYPLFMDDVETVRQIDDTALHWKANIAGRAVEWTAEITEQAPHYCIAWRNTGGPESSGRLEVMHAGPETTTVILTWNFGPSPSADSERGGDSTQRLARYLAELKAMIEAGESARTQGVPGNASVPMPGYSARPDILTADEEQPSPVLSDARIASTLGTTDTASSQVPAEAAPDTSEGNDLAQGNAMRHVGQIKPDR